MFRRGTPRLFSCGTGSKCSTTEGCKTGKAPLLCRLSKWALIGGLGYWAFGIYRSNSQQAAIAARMRERDDDEVHIYVFPRAGHGVNFSSPCTKLETYLRLAKIPYTAHYGMDTNESPTERLPYVELGSTQRVADSEFAIEAVQRLWGKEEELSAEQHARKVAIRRIAEDSLNWHAYRMLHVDNFDCALEMMDSMIPSFIPRPIASFVVEKMMRQKIIKTLNTMGEGDLTNDQYRGVLMDDIKALETMLKSSKAPFALGQEPTSADAALYAKLAFLMSMDDKKMVPGTANAVTYVKSSPVFLQYAARVEAAAFPDRDNLFSSVTSDGTEEKFTSEVW